MSPVVSAGTYGFYGVAADETRDPARLVIVGDTGNIIYSIRLDEEEDTGFEYFEYLQASRFTYGNLNGIDFGEGVFVACGDTGILGYSSAGESWTKTDSGTSEDLNDVCFVTGSTAWVAVGNGGTVIRSSNNGITWSAVVSGVSDDLYAIASNGANLVAVGEGGLVITSSDGGATWGEGSNCPATTDLHAVVWYNDVTKWVIVGHGSTILRYDGADPGSFEAGSVDTEVDLEGVGWAGANGLLIAAGSGAVTVTSENGLAWTKQDSGATTTFFRAVEYLDSRFVAVGNEGKVAYSATGTGVRSYDQFVPISDEIRATAFCQSGAYMNYGGIMQLEGSTWVYYPTKVISAAPGTVNDFDEAFGSWETNLPGDGAILAMASIEGGWVAARSDSVDLMTDGGSLDLPWVWNGNYGQGLRIISNWATFGGAAFGIFEDGLIYRADYNSVTRLPGFFDLTEFDDFNPGTEVVQINFDPQTQKLLVFRPESPWRLYFVDDQSGSVTEFDLPSFTESGVTYEPKAVFVPKNETIGLKVGYGTDDAAMDKILTVDFEFDTAPTGFDSLYPVSDGEQWHGQIVTGCFRLTQLGHRGEIVKVVLRTSCDEDSTVRPHIAMAVKQEPEDEWVWVREGTHPGTIAVDGSVPQAVGTGTAWSHLIVAGGAGNPVTVPCLVEKITRVYDGVTGLDLTYTKNAARAINLTVTPAVNDVYVEWGPSLPYVYGEAGDFLLLSDGSFCEIDTVDRATFITPLNAPSDFTGSAEYIETKEMPGGDDKGDGKLIYGLEDGFDQIMLKIVMLVPDGNDSQWAKISGIEIGYRPTGPELKTDGG